MEDVLPIPFKTILNQVTLNLKVMGDIKDGDKLSTVNKYIEIDSYSYLQCIYRKYNGDSRLKTLEKIDEVINDTISLSQQLLNNELNNSNVTNLPDNTSNAKILQDLIPDMIDASKGIRNLKLTYKNDVLTENKLDMAIKKLNDQVDKIKNSMKVY